MADKDMASCIRGVSSDGTQMQWIRVLEEIATVRRSMRTCQPLLLPQTGLGLRLGNCHWSKCQGRRPQGVPKLRVAGEKLDS